MEYFDEKTLKPWVDTERSEKKINYGSRGREKKGRHENSTP